MAYVIIEKSIADNFATIADISLNGIATLYRVTSREPIADINTPFFATRADAFSNVTDPKTQTVKFICSDSEDTKWRRRERDRFSDGKYTAVPWADDLSGRYAYTTASTAMASHYAHVSLEVPGMMAYTPDSEHGVQDRQIRTTVGRYLTKFASHLMTTEKIAEFVSLSKVYSSELKIATTADEIEEVYVHGPRSCMAHRGRQSTCVVCSRDGGGTHYNYGSHVHPTRVYGDSDLAVAYLGSIETHVIARAVIWPAKKRYSTIYGDEMLLTRILENAGYSDGSLHGARVRVIPSSDSYVMPYIDGFDTVSKNGRYFVLDDGGEFECNNTNGLTELENTCSHCGDRCPADETYCYDCENNRMTCENCSEDFFDSDNGQSINGSWYCDSCADNMAQTCESCSDRFFEEEFSSRKQRERRANGTDIYCDDCADSMHVCIDCDETFDDRDFTPTESCDRDRRRVNDYCKVCADDIQICHSCKEPFDIESNHCDHCGITIRCDVTMDLLQAVRSDRPITVGPTFDLQCKREKLFFYDGMIGHRYLYGRNGQWGTRLEIPRYNPFNVETIQYDVRAADGTVRCTAYYSAYIAPIVGTIGTESAA